MTSRAQPPVVVLGGSTNALSIARSLGRIGVAVHVSVTEGGPASYSRYRARVYPIPPRCPAQEHWARLLLPSPSGLEGSVLFVCNDDAVEFIARHRDGLAGRYVLDDAVPGVQQAMLDKRRTLELAAAAGIGIPRFWAVNGVADIDRLAGDLLYPAIVKPLHSHEFQKKFGGRKFFSARDAGELRARLRDVLDAGLGAMINEWVPGPDSLLASYYSYIDRSGTPLFDFTKRIIRRFPKNQGLACYHATTWDPEMAALGRRFFEAVGLRGLGNVEFKKDLRDGVWKVIECNPRFTAAQELLVRAGIDIAVLIYRHLTGGPLPDVRDYRRGVRLWYPVRDLRAFLELRRLGELTTIDWLRSVLHPQALPYFRATDPLPSIAPHLAELGGRLRLAK
jgi:predicted ATP-grasp superfamily ATP-dependent carboligase